MSLLPWLAGLAVAADLEVGGTGYATVQEALDAAQSGDRLLLHSGVWVGSHAIFDPDPDDGLPFELVIEPMAGADVTLESTGPLSGYLRADGSHITLRDVTIDASAQRAAKVANGGSLTLERVDVFDGRRINASGGAVFVEDDGSSLRVEGGAFRNSVATGSGNGGAVAVEAGASATFVGVRFEGNRSDSGGGALRCAGLCVVTDSRFVGNEATGMGGAILVEGAPGFDLDGSVFCDNTSVQQAGALAVVDTTGAGDLGHNVFFGSVAGQQGGAVYSDSPLVLFNSDFVANQATQQGSAVYASGAVQVINTIVVDHDQSQQIFYGPGLVARDITLFDNTLPVVDGNASIVVDQTADPQYVRYLPDDCEGSDLHLQPGSPALQVGDPVYGVHHGALGEVCVPAPEVPGDNIDQDCDGVDLCYLDLDMDGVGGPTTVPGVGPVCNGLQESRITGDCDDDDPTRFPGNLEVPVDGVDGDCDGLELCFADDDGDGYGAGEATFASSDLTCTAPGFSPFDTDCRPDDPTVSPGSPELCDNGIDDDCDGEIDTDAEPVWWYRDADQDGYGDSDDAVEQCSPPNGYVDRGGDCDDTDPGTHPGAPERCDGVDQNCNDLIDEGLAIVRSWEDADGDGYGNPDAPHDGCRPPGFVDNDTDCDDTDSRVNPGALELCNGIDDNCDGELAACDLDGRGGVGDGPEAAASVAGCGCGSTGAGWGWAGLLAAVASARRRCPQRRQQGSLGSPGVPRSVA